MFSDLLLFLPPTINTSPISYNRVTTILRSTYYITPGMSCQQRKVNVYEFRMNTQDRYFVAHLNGTSAQCEM